jgi:hypothetical protein
MALKIINASKDYSNDAEVLHLFDAVSGGPTILYADGRAPLIVTPIGDAREFLTARVAEILATEDTLDDTLRRLELRLTNDGSTVVWREFDEKD